MPDAHFAVPRLAQVYDLLDPDRQDLVGYAEILDELGARSVLDVGCGTGTFALLLASRGIEVIGVDPAIASLDVARSKPGSESVTWIHGDASAVTDVTVDAVTMTGNVAQVFLNDSEWRATLDAVWRALRRGGYLVFETRDPGALAWRSWTPADSRRVAVVGDGTVESWVEVTDVTESTVSFRTTFVFSDDGVVLTSDSTLRFRGRDEIVQALEQIGFEEPQIRDAPDRPGSELVFIARRPQ